MIVSEGLIVKTINSPSDLELILRLIEPLIGEYCIEASLSFGTELYLEFKQKALNELGDWTITTRASDWHIEKSSKIILTSHEEYNILERKVQRLVNTQIVKLDIVYETLSFIAQFGNQDILVIKPFLDEDVEGVADWRIYTPEKMVVEVGPGRFWDYVSVDDI